ncbi:Cupin domain-containing protein [Sinomicrobium oceani]|uniref:Cupin domain-containing protein n=1 Tax=Sinomicrobium oceani TaxID=1150368 RepID=A0A1K1QIE6_9FLAO|nr:cupin domain-containing protein [Sinomicrobium oceani]SFW59425.1 Cupin domain-containing protein [Sinomicrobium oceani]
MKITLDNAIHYTWGDGCDGWFLLKSPGLTVIQEKMPPGTEEKLHYHNKTQQLFYILSGMATIIIDDNEYRVAPGEGFHIPPGKKHRIRNREESDLHFIVISEPESHGDRINAED